MTDVVDLQELPYRPTGNAYADLDQSYLFRPLPSYGSHRTPVAGLWHCGASTYPGPELDAASGRIVAKRLLEGSVLRRLPTLRPPAGWRLIGTARSNRCWNG